MSIVLLWSHLSSRSYLTRTGDASNMIFAKLSAVTSQTVAGIVLALMSMARSATQSAVKPNGHSGDITRAIWRHVLFEFMATTRPPLYFYWAELFLSVKLQNGHMVPKVSTCKSLNGHSGML